jgi:hypothetical protein
VALSHKVLVGPNQPPGCRQNGSLAPAWISLWL